MPFLALFGRSEGKLDPLGALRHRPQMAPVVRADASPFASRGHDGGWLRRSPLKLARPIMPRSVCKQTIHPAHATPGGSARLPLRSRSARWAETTWRSPPKWCSIKGTSGRCMGVRIYVSHSPTGGDIPDQTEDPRVAMSKEGGLPSSCAEIPADISRGREGRVLNGWDAPSTPGCGVLLPAPR